LANSALHLSGHITTQPKPKLEIAKLMRNANRMCLSKKKQPRAARSATEAEDNIQHTTDETTSQPNNIIDSECPPSPPPLSPHPCSIMTSLKTSSNFVINSNVPPKIVDRYNTYLDFRKAGKNHAQASALMCIDQKTIQNNIKQYNLQPYSTMAKRKNPRKNFLDDYKIEILNYIRIYQNNNKQSIRPCHVKKFIIESDWGSLFRKKSSNAQGKLVYQFFKHHSIDISNIRFLGKERSDGITYSCTEVNCVRRCEKGNHCVYKQLLLSRRKASTSSERFKCGGKKGWGLRLKHPVKKGDFVIEYYGRIVTDDEIAKNAGKNQYWLSIIEEGSRKEVIIDGNIHSNKAKYINQSCYPNCKAWVWSVHGKDRVAIVALRSIPAKTEITFDYGWKKTKGVRRTPCLCGADNCRKWMEM
jgi:hypothetical protein